MPPVPLFLRDHVAEVASRLIDWYAGSGRHFPWRLAPRVRPQESSQVLHDPYMILVSEVMLQQTGTARVVEMLPRFLQTFPSIAALAGAPKADLIRAWKGMGYNRRVLNLQRAAQVIQREYNGEMPRSVEQLLSLPGIGRYTASAVCCFAFGQRVAVVDVNILRVLGRIFQRQHSDTQRAPESIVWRLDEAALPEGEAYRWHQALMDLGATICMPLRPRCSVCPLEQVCLSAHPPLPALFDTRRTTTIEPMILGTPRRIWRGRVVEAMRGEEQAVRLKDLLDRLLPPDAELPARRLLLDVVGALLADGLLARTGSVHEGDLGEIDHITLPRN